MARPENQPRNEIVLNQPTPIVIAALKVKNQAWTVSEGREALPDIEGPALIFRDTVVLGEASILGWLDRRYPLPSLFPSDVDLYARVATLAHALELHPEQAPRLWEALQDADHKTDFLAGRHPTIADLALWAALRKLDPEAADEFEERLFSVEDF